MKDMQPIRHFSIAAVIHIRITPAAFPVTSVHRRQDFLAVISTGDENTVPAFHDIPSLPEALITSCATDSIQGHRIVRA